MEMKRLFFLCCLAVLVPGCGSNGLSRSELESLVPGPTPNRVVSLELKAVLKDIPADGRELRLWMPLLQSDAHQAVSECRIVSPLRPMVRYDPVFGNTMMYFTGDEPLPASLTTSMSFRVELHRCPPADVVGTVPLAPEALKDLSFYLDTTHREEGLKQALNILAERITREREQDRPMLEAERDRLTVVYNRLSQGNASLREVTAGLADSKLSPLQQTRRVYDFVREKLALADTDVSSDRTLFEAWQSARVTPLEYARITVFLLRTLGIPARVEYGVVLSEPGQSAESSDQVRAHVWVGAYVSPGFWFSVDPVLAETQPDLTDYYFGTDCASRIRFGWGSDINLAPQQIGEPLPIFFEPRPEVDDKILPVEFSVTMKDLVAQSPKETKK